MSRVGSVEVPLSDSTGAQLGVLKISCLPQMAPPQLWDFRGAEPATAVLQDLRVLEDEEYVYRVETALHGDVNTTKPELFLPDYKDGKTGRLRPGLNVGELHAEFSIGGRILGGVRLEVLSKKLNYLSDFQSMLKTIAGYLAEIISERFAPTEQSFVPLTSRDAVTLYQQFAFLRAYIIGEEFQFAIRRILMAPDRHWTNLEERQPLARGIRTTAGMLRALSAPGPRQPNPGLAVNCPSIPLSLPNQTPVENVDTPENRFVLHILREWVAVASTVRDRLRGKSAKQQRGAREAAEVIAILEETLTAGLFRNVGALEVFPGNSTVLQNRDGYRELYRIFLQAQVAAQLAWDGGEDVYGAGQKNVSLLYEYWVFLVLAQIVSDLCNHGPLDVWSLVESTPDGLSLRLRQGRRFSLTGKVVRDGKRLRVTLFYNRSFKPNISESEGSWSREMVPDFSLRLLREDDPKRTAWLHFDAKYRVDNVQELFGPESATETEGSNGRESIAVVRYKPEDLLRMHAYKDAVRRSNGAFILFPGTKDERFQEFKEIVPGVGAFALRPTEDGPVGATNIARFLSDVLDAFVI